ncbi:acetylglutamate kinase [Chryseomicrobium palamuruense]|uniref:acetylglutamate kinase n=1 Tax=Chryseomicrobium palamuruense TaxID=682973 RepID=A0ABV8UUI2_9BACL
MTTSKSTQAIVPNCHVIKIGGSTLATLSDSFVHSLKRRVEAGQNVILVHGGGPDINTALAEREITSEVIDGIRVTTPEMIHIIRNTLLGDVNSRLVGKLNAAGISAVGLSGFDGLFSSDYLNQEVYQEVGEVMEVNGGKFELLLKAGIIPVLACIGVSPDGKPLNINADTLASGVASGVEAKSLLLVTDTPGIKRNGETVKDTTPTEIVNMIEDGTIYGGMIPKVKGALECLETGVKAVQITDDSLTGTTIHAISPYTKHPRKEANIHA